jgi:hypothetical protein
MHADAESGPALPRADEQSGYQTLSMSHVAMNLNPWTVTVVISLINIWGVLEDPLRSRRIGLVSRGTPLVCMRSLFIQGNDGVMRYVRRPFENPCAVDGTDDLGRLNMPWLDLVPLALHFQINVDCGPSKHFKED